MPQSNQKLSEKIRECRVASLGCEVTLNSCEGLLDTVEAVSFRDGEIVSVKLVDGSLFRRGALVRVSTRYTGDIDAVIVAFQFGGTQHPIQISSGGAEGEMVACVAFHEVVLFPKQTGNADVVTLYAKHHNAPDAQSA